MGYRGVLLFLGFIAASAIADVDRSAAAAERTPRLAIVVGEKAPALEHMAAEELSAMLGRLFEVKAEVGSKPDDAAAAVILVGQPATNPILAEAIGNNWPKLSDQGLVLRRLKTASPRLVVGGGSPVATLWAAYELGERLGIRYLHDRDVYPLRKPFGGLPELDFVMEPNMRIRCWRLVNELAHGSVSWSLEENRRILRQLAKMKYNRVYLGLWPCQPFVHYTFRGMSKPPGVLFFGQQFPIDDDTIGREKFAGMKTFTNPEFVGAEAPEGSPAACDRSGARHLAGSSHTGYANGPVDSALRVAEGVYEGVAGLGAGYSSGQSYGRTGSQPVDG